ncbi:MAG: DNA polymerase III subunit delta' [Clostridiales bacterium]|nr:DNA polymerase III subunit delta' [Clostridiales bacterium]
MSAAESAKGDLMPVLSDFRGQGALYDGLIRTLEDGSFVHAYLISGASGMGKRTLARLMAQYLLCKGERKPCGVCPACIQVRDGNHPDVITVMPGKPLSPEVKAGMASIPVDEIRHVNSLVGQHTFEGGRRIVIIERAEKMNQPAQNALLKTLEEPLAGTVFLLTTESPELLLPTIVSRCRALKMHPWPDDVVLKVLREHGVSPEMAQKALSVSGGSIGRAIAVAADEAYWQRRGDVMRDFFELQSRGDILKVSTAWKDRKDESDELLDDVEDMLRQLQLVRFGRQDEALLADYPPAWQRLAREGELQSFISLMEAVGTARRMRANQVTWQAVVEQLLLSLMEEKNRWSM